MNLAYQRLQNNDPLWPLVNLPPCHRLVKPSSDRPEKQALFCLEEFVEQNVVVKVDHSCSDTNATQDVNPATTAMLGHRHG